jgi:hypothetical protein
VGPAFRVRSRRREQKEPRTTWPGPKLVPEPGTESAQHSTLEPVPEWVSQPDRGAVSGSISESVSESVSGSVAEAGGEVRPAYYAARSGGWRDWWTLLHPPYTAWHLSYVVIGASLAPHVQLSRLLATLLAFFLAVGIAAHALDELHGRPLGTHISSAALVAVSFVALAGAVALGAVGVTRVGWVLVPFIAIGPLLVVAYNAEWLGGLVHTDSGFALAWGAFPVLTAYVAQAERLSLAAVIGAAGAFGLSTAQRALSTPARFVRRRVTEVSGSVVLRDGSTRRVDRAMLIQPVERTLRVLSWTVVLLAAAMAVSRLR